MIPRAPGAAPPRARARRRGARLTDAPHPEEADRGALVEAALAALAEAGVGGGVGAGVVVGSGAVRLPEELEGAVEVPYAAIPGFPRATLAGAPGRLVVGTIGGRRVALLMGRTHYHEGGGARGMWVPLEVLANLGATAVVLTSAAGSLHHEWMPGSLALVSDHINLAGVNPMHGVTGPARSVPMADLYEPRLRRRLKLVAGAGGLHLHEGVFGWFAGPTFETPAEVRMARTLGADLIGHSVVAEAVLARSVGLQVAAVTIVTTHAAGVHGLRARPAGGAPGQGERREAALMGAVALKRLVTAFLKMREEA